VIRLRRRAAGPCRLGALGGSGALGDAGALGGAAQLADPALLGPVDRSAPPWPGELLRLPTGRELYVRRTPPLPIEDARDSGAQFVYVHGLGGSSTNWTDLAAVLAPLGAGAAIDLPGFGRSPQPTGGNWSQSERIRAVIEYLEQPGDLAGRGAAGSTGPAAVDLVGNSMGGAVALAVAALRPDLVRSLTLISPAVPDLRVIAQLRQSPMPLMLVPGFGLLIERVLRGMTPTQRVAGTIRLCFGDPDSVDPARIAEAEQEAAERAGQPWSIRSGTGSLRGLVRAQLRIGSASMWSLAGRIAAPTLVVWGGRDRVVNPDRASRLVAAIPDCRLLVLPDAGHVAMIEDPLGVARAIAGLLVARVPSTALPTP
jgi:pimeloyl-ACP methyl ester carboxylesterase